MSWQRANVFITQACGRKHESSLLSTSVNPKRPLGRANASGISRTGRWETSENMASITPYLCAAIPTGLLVVRSDVVLFSGHRVVLLLILLDKHCEVFQFISIG